MNVTFRDAQLEIPAMSTARPRSAPAVAVVAMDDTPRLGGLARLVGLVSQGLTASWVPLCPDLTSEIGRRRD